MAQQNKVGTYPWFLVIIFFLLAIGIGIGGYFYYMGQKERLRHVKESKLAAIADLKTRQIESWRNERLEDTTTILENPILSPFLCRWLGDTSDQQGKRDILAWMELLRRQGYFDLLVLLDLFGKPQLTFPMEKNVAYPRLLVHDALRTQTVIFSDFFRSPAPDRRLFLFIIVPLVDSDEPAGTLLLRIDPSHFLFPFVQTRLESGRTSESILIEREENELVFLSELRFGKNSPQSLRFRIDQKKNLEVAEVFKNGGTYIGPDYRGVPVLAVVRKVSGSPWLLISKEDLSEVYAPLHDWARVILLGVCVAILGLGVLLGFLWRQQMRRYSRIRYEQELEDRVWERTRELEAVNKELEAFSYSISHDLRSPLRAMSGFNQIILDEYSGRLDEKAKQLLTRGIKASQRMAELIDGLLVLFRYSRITMQWKTVDLSQMATSILEVYRQHFPARNAEFLIQPGVTARGDERLLHVVLENLLDNAWKFTAVRDPARIEFGQTQIDGRTAYYVRDNGVGFDMKYADQLFTTFTRLHHMEDYSGTGIGLAAVQRILRRHGGKVWAEGQEEKGATFYFSIGNRSGEPEV